MPAVNLHQYFIHNAAGQYVRRGRKKTEYCVVDQKRKGDLFGERDGKVIGYRIFGSNNYTLEQCTPKEWRFWRASLASRKPSKARREAARRNAKRPRRRFNYRGYLLDEGTNLPLPAGMDRAINSAPPDPREIELAQETGRAVVVLNQIYY